MVIYLDGADPVQMHTYHEQVAGYTTNPSLMRKCGISNYREFAQLALGAAGGKPVSFEVFADDRATIIDQAREIASWGDNVFVKIPITNTEGVSQAALIRWLWKEHNIKVNVTAIMTEAQIAGLANNLSAKTPMILSIFAGRIADTGVNPEITVAYAKMRYGNLKNVKILWASTRELYNIKQAEQAGADIITVTTDILNKMHLIGKDLAQYSLETVQMFYNDGREIKF